jgi:hypothetical protein
MAWNKLSDKEKKEFTDLPYFSKEGFEFITWIKIDDSIKEMTLKDVCEKLGYNVKIIK